MPIFSFMMMALAGIVLYAANQQLYIAIRKRGSALHLSFSVISMAIVGSIFGNILIANSGTVEGIVAATRLRVVCVSIGTAVLPWFVSYYTGFRPRAFMTILSASVLLFMIARILDPSLLTYDVISHPGNITLPWDEQISVFSGRTNRWMYVYYCNGFITLGFLYAAAAHLFRRGHRTRAAALAVSALLILATSINDMVVIMNNLRWILLGDIGWLSMITLIELTLIEDILKAGEIKKSLVESERTLRISEEKYRLLAENVTDVIWTMDLAGNTTYISPSTEKLHGWTVEEWKNIRLEDNMTPESLRIIYHSLQKELELAARPDYDRERVVTAELEQIRKDRTKVWTEISSKFIWDAGGKPAGLIGVTRDISKRKKAEEALLRHNLVLTEINRLGIELASLPSGDGIHAYLAQELKKISGAAAAIVSEYDQARSLLEVKHFVLDESIPLTGENIKLIDSYLKSIPVTGDDCARMMTETVVFRETLNELTFGAVPPDISAYIDRTFGLDRYIGISYMYEGTLYGTSVLAMKAGVPAPSRELLSSFASLAAVSLRRNRAEEMLRKSLEEKNVLIKEVHHRVKNNMQIIVSLLHMQSHRITDPAALTLHHESISRLHSMALIHESIYRSENLTDINMEQYSRELVSLLLATYAMDERALRVEIDVREVSLNVNQAVPFALLLNELVTNVLKHGIKQDGGPGYMKISFSRAGETYRLAVADRGPGMDADAFNSGEQTTLGLQLIKALAKQLGGSVTLTADDGCRFTLEFPAT